MMTRIAAWWREAAAVAAIVLIVWQFQEVRSDASDAKQIMEQQSDINTKLASLIAAQDDENRELNTRMKVYLEIYGFSDSTAQAWAEMPREAPHDSLGNGIPWEPWLRTDSTLQVGERLMFNDSGRILVQTLWDFREKAKK